MKQLLNRYIDEHTEELSQLSKTLFENPELGFKEFRTGEIIREFAARHGINVDKEYAYTGFSLSIGSGKPHIGIIAELDALPTLGHPYATNEDHAAHSCGHSTQLVIGLGALCALKENGLPQKGTVTLFFTPAEEFVDLDYRKNLVKEGKIRYLSGKQNMIAEHVIDDVDLFIHFHASGPSDLLFNVNTDLAGFTYKKYRFIGKAAHAAVTPYLGINAINMLNLFLNAVNALRETFRDEDMVRVHGYITKGGTVINSIPEEVIYESYQRSINPEFLLKLSHEIDNAAIHCAKALGGECIVEEIPGYLPLIQNREISKTVYENMLQFADKDKIGDSSKSVAAGDVGDISMFKPIIQFGYSGFKGTIHGKDLEIADEDLALIRPAKILAGSVYDFLTDKARVEKVISAFEPKMTFEQYLAYLNGSSK
ncbi:MAG: amidohydrolase [Erysipelotrichaceae bacterium]|nr:amidohydrolase [Erysipelotrichaceae bacterium]